MKNIHKTACISDKATIGDNVKIGPFCVIGDEVILKDGVELKSHVVLDGITIIGENTVIFPFASIGNPPQDLKFHGEKSSVIIGKNNVIREYCTIQSGTESGIMKTVVGDNCLLMVGTHIAHDCVVGDHVIFANMATLGGHVIVGDHVVIGGLSAVHQHVRIGKHAMIGGVTAVIRDVVPFATVFSDRASIEGVNITGLKRRGYDKSDIINLNKAFKEIFFEDNSDIKESLSRVSDKYKGSPLIDELIEFMSAESKRSYTTASSSKIKI